MASKQIQTSIITTFSEWC